MTSIKTAIQAFLVLACLAGPVAADPWVQYVDETPVRLVADPAVGAVDVEEKDYAWDDVDLDGDVDLVVVRKQPYSVYGKRTNVLLLNEGGVLVDRTSEYATASSVPGDEGFLTPTADRDVVLADLDQDGWPDIVTAVALAPDTEPKSLGHPRIYMNLGEDGDGNWLGFRYEEDRIPAMLSAFGLDGLNPRFLGVAAGDVTGDGYPDLYFTDTNLGGGHLHMEDFDDKLLINDGLANPGYFVDQTNGAFPGTVPGSAYPFPRSGHAPATAIADVNDDTVNELLKVTTLTAPQYLAIAYDDPVTSGFDSYDVIYSLSGTFFSLGDLNRDALPDVVVTDDGADRFLLNQGGDVADFLQFTFSFAYDGPGTGPTDDGFGGNSVTADLDNDGWNDVMIADIDEDIPGCSRRMHLYHNQGGDVGGIVTLTEETSGTQCASFLGNPPTCLVSGIPSDRLEGVHDVAVFDIDQDGWLDLVLGRCSGTEIYMNTPPVPAGTVPDGLDVPGTPLTVAREPNGRIRLTWDPSCDVDDTDFVVYEGAIGNFASHEPLTCSTGGASTSVFVPTFGNRYYLVAPSNGSAEGSPGTDSQGIERTQGLSSCLTRVSGACD